MRIQRRSRLPKSRTLRSPGPTRKLLAGFIVFVLCILLVTKIVLPEILERKEVYHYGNLGLNSIVEFSWNVSLPKKNLVIDDPALWVDEDSRTIFVSLLSKNALKEPKKLFPTAVFPQIQFRDRILNSSSNVSSEEPRNHSFVEWDKVYGGRESFKMPSWATLPERNTLDRASIFVSIASYEDNQCASTVKNLFERARSPFRVYVGISEEGKASPQGCLEHLSLDNHTAVTSLMWGKPLPSAVSVETRTFQWKDVLGDRLAKEIHLSGEEISLEDPSCTCETEKPQSEPVAAKELPASIDRCVADLEVTYHQCLPLAVIEQAVPSGEENETSVDKAKNEEEGNVSSLISSGRCSVAYTCYMKATGESTSTQPVPNEASNESSVSLSSENHGHLADLALPELNCILAVEGKKQYICSKSDEASEGTSLENWMRIGMLHCNRAGHFSRCLVTEETQTLPQVAASCNCSEKKVVYLEEGFHQDELSCVGTTIERARDEFLLALHGILPSQHPRYRSFYSYLSGISPEKLDSLRKTFPLRHGSAPQQQLTPAIAGCRIFARRTASANAAGPTFARYISSLFFFQQDYYMMIDSHSRFSFHWDSKMIQRIFQLPTRGILSHYPNGYTPEDNEVEWSKNNVMCMCKGVFLQNGMPKLGANWREKLGHPTLQAFAAAGYIFGDAQFTMDTPFDPFLLFLFDGEEALYSARIWTHGWDLYCPREVNVLHYYGRPKSPKYWTQMTPPKTERKTLSEKRALYLMQLAKPWASIKHLYSSKLYVPPSQRLIVKPYVVRENEVIRFEEKLYGMGNKRTLRDYWHFTQMSDDFVVKKDSENRWEGGKDLCEL